MSRRRALLIGIDRYPYLGHLLPSCVLGAQQTQAVLASRFGFETQFLLDAEATRLGILAALESLAEKVSAGDSVVFYYTGHGNQQGAANEPDGFVRGLAASDHGCGGESRLVTQWELYDWLIRVSTITSKVTVVLDTCFAGKVVREGACARPKCLPALGLQQPSMNPRQIVGKRWREAGPSGWLPFSDRYTLLAACRARESANYGPTEIGERCAFTFELCRELERIPDGASYRDLIGPVRWRVQQRFAAQTPQVEGAIDREVFGGGVRPRVLFRTLLARDGEAVRLDGGRLHGISVGAVSDVYVAGSKSLDDPESSLGRLITSEVGPSESVATIVSEKEKGVITSGAWAVERESGHHGVLAGVSVEPDIDRPELSGELQTMIERSPLLTLVGAGDSALARVRCSPRSQGEGGLVWEARDDLGELLRTPIAVREPNATRNLVLFLEARARQRAILDLAINGGDHEVSRSLEVALAMWEGTTRRTIEADAGDEPVLTEGTRVGISIRHSFQTPLHIHVFDLGVGGGIDLLFPVRGARDLLEAGPRLDVSQREAEAFRVSIPDHVPNRDDLAPLVGRERVVVFATVGEVDLSEYEQRAVRDGNMESPRGHSLAHRWTRMMQGRRLRDGVSPSGAPDLWGAAILSFGLVRQTSAR